MNEVTVRALIAGWITGAAVAFANTAVLLLWLARSQAAGRNWLPGWEQVKPPIIGILFVNILLLLWTAFGLVLGALYLRARSDLPGAGLLSPNLAFTVTVAGVLLVSLGLLAFIRRGVGWQAWSVGLLAAGAFGWLLPNLAR